MDIYTFEGQREIYLSRTEFNNLETFEPNSKAPNNEGTLKLFNIDNTTKLIKAFYYTRRLDTVKNTIDILITHSQALKEHIPSLVLPEDYVYIDNPHNHQIGCTFKPIKGTNLQDILSDDLYSYRKKLSLLKELGKIIDKFGSIPNFPYKVFIGDLHEGNIIVTKRNKIKIIDTTSLYIDSNYCEAQPSKYLEFNKTIKEEKYKDKYPMQPNGIIIPNRNTDIFCYSFTILNTLSKAELSLLSLNTLMNYLDYLEHLKFNKDFLYSITRLFSLEENINPYPYLNSITKNQYKKATYLSYKIKTNFTPNKFF